MNKQQADEWYNNQMKHVLSIMQLNKDADDTERNIQWKMLFEVGEYQNDGSMQYE